MPPDGVATVRVAGTLAPTWCRGEQDREPRDASRFRGRLRANGVHRRLATSTRPDAGWAALTDSELAVVRLIAAGLTNRETALRLFVSPHTVNSHLCHAFTKLGVNSRLELAHVIAAHAGEPALDN